MFFVETILKADIFFFVTTIAVVAITLGMLVVGYFCIRLLRTLNEVSEVVRDEAKLIKSDIDGARATIRSNAEIVGTIIGAVARGGASAKRKSKKTK